ncbi:MAG: YcgN family cysteine cluster protein [Pseudomonadota bacterium]
MSKQSPIEDRYWERKKLSQMSSEEWESLCDGCGQCCMAKLIDDDTDEIHYTTVACRLFDAASCQCSDYDNRQKQVEDCIKLTPENVGELAWLPGTCAYRLIHDGKPLYNWHPLISGDPQSVLVAGVSVFGKITAMEQDLVHEGEYLDHLVEPIE